LTYQTPRRKSNAKVQPCPPGTYERWRAAPPEAVLREPGGATVPPAERLLQRIWAHQRLRREALATFDGRPLVVLHPGFPNPEAGPDFRDALLQFGDAPPVSGDVEVDQRPGGWRQHGHDRNPAFRNVRLHVVWNAPPAESFPLPTLALEPVLDAPLEALEDQLRGSRPDEFPAAWRGACAAPLAALSPGALAALLDQAAGTRLRLKAARCIARARQVGWTQALWEGLFAALGYKHNTWPMRRLAELADRVLADLETHPPAPFEIQVRLLGLAGLLPAQPARRRADHDAWVRRAWDLWWRWQAAVADCVLPRRAWRLHGSRPANHPQRRLALAAHWLATPHWPDRWPAWLARAATVPARVAVAELHNLLQPGPDPFWEHHWTLTGATLPSPQPLLGAARATDLALNVLLPWLRARAESGTDPAWTEQAERLYLTWPAAQDNARLRLAGARLLAGRPGPRPFRAATQQGLLQILDDFCAASNARCDGCPFPERVRTLAGGLPGAPSGAGTAGAPTYAPDD
jgi:hypothetical protein